MIDPGPCARDSVRIGVGSRVWVSVWDSAGDRVWNSLEEES